jgi:hypothetical protein
MNGTVPANAKVLRERGPAATIYFGAMVLVGMIVGVVGVLAVAAIIVAGFTASGPEYGVVAAVALGLLAVLCIWFVVRMVQFLRASKAFRERTD